MDLVLVRVTEISNNGDVSVTGQITASFGPAETDDLMIGQSLEVEVDEDDYPVMARTLDGQVIFPDERPDLGRYSYRGE